jgi:hypothetical protein
MPYLVCFQSLIVIIRLLQMLLEQALNIGLLRRMLTSRGLVGVLLFALS